MEPELPPELQGDQDRYYREIMGPVDQWVFVAEWHSSSAVSVKISDDQLWCHLLHVRGLIGGPQGDPVEFTVAVPLDSAKDIGANMVRVADKTDEELWAEGREI